MTTTRAAVYCRISADREGTALGVARQEEDCRALAARLGATVTTVYTDNDVSASNASTKPRPQYEAMLAAFDAGRVDMIVSYSNSRLTRRPAQWIDLIRRANDGRLRIATVVSGQHDLTTADGRAVALTVAAWDAAEAERTSERARRKKLDHARAGTWKGGRRPFGYEKDGVTVREVEARAIRDAGDAVLAGASVRSIARTWNDAGLTTTTGKAWRPADPRRILLRPRNAGLMEHRGEVIGAASWPAIVDREKWQAVRDILTDTGRRTVPASSAVKYLGSGLYHCSMCDGTIRASGSPGQVVAYRCPAAHVVRNQREVDGHVSAVVVERLRRGDLAALIPAPTPVVDVRAMEAEALALTERRDGLADSYADGAIDRAAMERGTRRINDTLDRIRADLAAVYAGTGLDGIADAPDPGQAWLDAPLDAKRRALALLVTVTLDPSPRGRRAGWRPGTSYFRPESVRIEAAAVM